DLFWLIVEKISDESFMHILKKAAPDSLDCFFSPSCASVLQNLKIHTHKETQRVTDLESRHSKLLQWFAKELSLPSSAHLLCSRGYQGPWTRVIHVFGISRRKRVLQFQLYFEPREVD